MIRQCSSADRTITRVDALLASPFKIKYHNTTVQGMDDCSMSFNVDSKNRQQRNYNVVEDRHNHKDE